MTEELTSVSAEVVETEPANNQAEKSPGAAKRKPPPAFTRRPDYVVEPPDLIKVDVDEALPGRPIAREYLVRPDGKISLGFYGEIFVAGLTVPEIKIKIIKQLQTFIRDEPLGLVVLDENGEPIIDLASGKPKNVAPEDSKAVRVEVAQCNSKYFYVEGEVVSAGRFPVTGTQGILHAIRLAGGLSPLADRANVILYRIGPEGAPRRLALDLHEIERRARPSAIDQLKSGDRLVVRRREQNHASPENSIPKTPQARSQGYRAMDSRGGGGPIEPLAHDDDAPDDPALRRLEKRMAELERKVDQILNAIKRQPG
jgi:protein involved in polysaccharide export with SLBB domain